MADDLTFPINVVQETTEMYLSILGFHWLTTWNHIGLALGNRLVMLGPKILSDHSTKSKAAEQSAGGAFAVLFDQKPSWWSRILASGHGVCSSPLAVALSRARAANPCAAESEFHVPECLCV
ncbi:hypothetical protein Tco_0977254 [Tanacetum coccineum]|uniref:Uncharacterized protein n=1 Tax=Tanacetum coccineum TaxID=301880 RepID=A0ABQ5EK21_9ASTR